MNEEIACETVTSDAKEAADPEHGESVRGTKNVNASSLQNRDSSQVDRHVSASSNQTQTRTSFIDETSMTNENPDSRAFFKNRDSSQVDRHVSASSNRTQTRTSYFHEASMSNGYPDSRAFFKFLEHHRLESKFVYVLTVCIIVFLSYATLSAQWFIPYFYAIVTPILLLLRVGIYWRLKYQYFLLDFCYFGNIFIYINIWAFPSNESVFIVSYTIATGPLLWSLLVFRNSLVFHSLDKVTSTYIHSMPPILVYVIRWYPEETSRFWYSSFPKCETSFSALTLIFVPLSFPIVHQFLYSILVYCILKPSEEYLYTYTYLISKETSLTYKICHYFGSQFQHFVFVTYVILMMLVVMALNMVWYNYFAGNCAVLVFLMIVAVYNGASYYLDVFGLGPRSKDKDQSDKIDNSQTCRSIETTNNGLKVYDTVVNISSASNSVVIKPVDNCNGE